MNVSQPLQEIQYVGIICRARPALISRRFAPGASAAPLA
jgi:hypothetical protein